MHFEELQNIRLFLVSFIEPEKCLLVFTQAQVGLHESGSGNVARLFALLQFLKEVKGFRAASGLSISVDQKADERGAAAD